MKKTLIALTLLLALVATALSAPAATLWDGFPKGIVRGGSYTLQSDTSATSKSVGTVNAGESVYILEVRSEWYRVMPVGRTTVGWMPFNAVEWQGGFSTGMVISESASLRNEPKTTATRLINIKNGESFFILSTIDDWYYVCFYDSKSGSPLWGYIRNDFIIENPWYITMPQATYAYSMPTRDSKKVGQLISGTQLPVIGEYGDFFVVNLRSASAFIAKRDVGY